MSERKTIGCVLLAAGLGRRFGGDKLRQEFRGRPLYLLAMELLPAALPSAVVSGDAEILRAARERGFLAMENTKPEEGISRSIRLGIQALSHCSALLFMVGDQPLLRSETVLRILQAGESNPQCIIVPKCGERTGNPCLFPARFFPELCALQGDKGGKRVISAHPEDIIAVEVEASELFDTDTREALQELEREK